MIAHLDPNRRKALFDELAKLGAQVWMTGADPAAVASPALSLVKSATPSTYDSVGRRYVASARIRF